MSARGGGLWAAGLLVSCVCAILSGCGPKSGPPATLGYEPGWEPASSGPIEGAVAPPAEIPSSTAAGQQVVVRGAEGFSDLGPVPLGSTHVVTFVIENPTDRAIRFRTIRGECDCIEAQSRPTGIEPHGSVSIPVRYTAPQRPRDYDSRVIIATDEPARRVIALRVASKAPRQ